jgi:uncharacterized protein YfiM (DUF2279 family)
MAYSEEPATALDVAEFVRDAAMLAADGNLAVTREISGSKQAASFKVRYADGTEWRITVGQA